MEREDEIRLIAYNIWEEEGCLDGLDCEHWYRAETVWEQQQNQKPAINNAIRRPTKSAEVKTRVAAERKRSKKA